MTIISATDSQTGTIKFTSDAATITLKDGETAVITELPLDANYKVTETPNKYSVVGGVFELDDSKTKKDTGTIEEDPDLTSFTNTYTEEDYTGQFPLTGTKKLSDSSITTIPVFSYELVEADSTYKPLAGATAQTITNDTTGAISETISAGKLNFGTETTIVKYYVLTEKDLTTAQAHNYIKDDSEKHIKVTFTKPTKVKDVINGTVVYDPTSIEFINTVKTGGLKVTKTVEPESGVTAPDQFFTFNVKVVGAGNKTFDTVLTSGTSELTGNVTFTSDVAEIKLKDGQTLEINGLPLDADYEVTETSDKISVIGGVFEIDATKTSGNTGVIAETATTASFTNTYTKEDYTGQFTLDGTKKLSDTSITVIPVFNFELVEADSNYTPLAGAPVQIITNDSTGAISKTISVGALDFGSVKTITKYYVLTEQDLSKNIDTTYPKKYVKDDTEVHIKVTFNKPSKLKDVIDGNVSSTPGTIEFTNTVKTFGFNIHKKGMDDDSDALANVTFDLYKKINSTATQNRGDKIGKDGSVITGASDIVTDNNGLVSITGLKAGEYILIESAVPDRKDYVLDTTEYTITVSDIGEVSASPQLTVETIGTDDYFIINNNKTPRGDLTILKGVTNINDVYGAAENAEFIVQVSFTDDANKSFTGEYSAKKYDVNGSYTDTTVTFTTGVSELISLKHGELIEINGILAGAKYKVEEVDAKTSLGYSINEHCMGMTGEIKDKRQTSEITTALVFNDFTETKIKISKVETGAGDELPGATIQLKDKDGVVIEEWTSGDTPHEIKVDYNGTYTLSETVAPFGYDVTTDTTVVVKDGKIDTSATTTRYDSETGRLLVEDAAKILKISKVETGAGDELPGATIQLKDEDGKVIDEWISEINPHEVRIPDLKPGKTYTLSETVAPDGYSITTDTTFTLDENGKIDKSKTTTKVSEDVLLIEDDRTCVYIKKTDETGEKELAGATLQILDKKNAVVEEWVSDDSKEGHKITGLITGETYTLHETIAPDGYKLTADTTFKLDKYGKIDSSTTTPVKSEDGKTYLLVEDDMTIFGFTKEGYPAVETCSEIADPNEISAISGVTFKAYEVDAIGEKIDGAKEYTATSNSAGKVIFEKLPKGRYAVVEVSAPDDFEVDETVYYAVVDDGEFTGLTDVNGDNATKILINDRYRADIKMVKVNESKPNQKLPGSTYGLFRTDSDDEEPIKIASSVTGKNGEIEFKGVLTNVEYEVKELVAPDGYYVSEKPITIKFIVNDKGEVEFDTQAFNDGNGTAVMNSDGTITWLEPQVEAKFLKTDMSGNALPGAQLKVVDDKGNAVAEWTSTKEEYVLTGVLKCGETYKLVEVAAPEGYEIADPIEFTVAETAAANEAEKNLISITMMDAKEETTTEDTTENTTETTTEKTTEVTSQATTERTTQATTQRTTESHHRTNVVTGDQNPIVLFIIALAIAGAAICVIFFIKKKSSGNGYVNDDKDEDEG